MENESFDSPMAAIEASDTLVEPGEPGSHTDLLEIAQMKSLATKHGYACQSLNRLNIEQLANAPGEVHGFSPVGGS